MGLNEITTPALSPEQVKWLKQMDITDYSVDNEGFVNVEGNVDISRRNLISIPVKFGYVGGHFNCSNSNLSSLKGAPKEVGGDFYCRNSNLTSLEGGTKGSRWRLYL